MLYKTKLQHDGWGQSLELIYTQKFQKVGMSILDDTKLTYHIKNSKYKLSHYLHSNEYFENKVLDFPSLKTIYSP